MPSALITGGTGYIGSRLALALRDRGWAVSVLSRNPESSDSHEALVKAGIALITADIGDAGALRGTARGMDTVFHLASVSGGHPTTMEETNIEGTRNIVAECSQAGSGLVYAGTTAVYGDTGGRLVDEDTEPTPNTHYARTRLVAEGLVLGEGGTVVRLGTVYGPNSPVIRDFLLKDGNVRVVGNGRNTANVIHVDDAVAVLTTAATQGRPGRVYIATDGNPVTPREFYGKMASLLGRGKPRFVGTARLRALTSVFGFMGRITGVPPVMTADTLRLLTNSVAADSGRIRDELGFVPAYPDHARGLGATFGQEDE